MIRDQQTDTKFQLGKPLRQIRTNTITNNINIEGNVAGNNPIAKKGSSKARGRVRSFRQVINKTKLYFDPVASPIGYIQIQILTTRISNRPTTRTYCFPSTRPVTVTIIRKCEIGQFTFLKAECSCSQDIYRTHCLSPMNRVTESFNFGIVGQNVLLTSSETVGLKETGINFQMKNEKGPCPIVKFAIIVEIQRHMRVLNK